MAAREWVGIRDTAWHHVAWKYTYEEDLHQLFLDGKLIWKMKSPDGRKLFSNRRHLAQLIGLLTEGLVRETGLEPTRYR